MGNSNITCDNQFCVNLMTGDLILIGSLQGKKEGLSWPMALPILCDS